MKLSICIPIYNVDVSRLVTDLVSQAKTLAIDWEVICMDDASSQAIKDSNRTALQTLLGVSYIELEHNLGRAKIRNWLCKAASGSHLLYLDCDSGIIRDDFLHKYVKENEKEIIYGGRNYTPSQPSQEYLLHWLYGKRYESLGIKQRQLDPVTTFLSCNFLVKAEVLEAVPFDEDVAGYGYEDLLWARKCSLKAYKISHLDNPICHLDLDNNANFVKKVDESLLNLYRLRNSGQLPHTKLTRWQKSLSEWELDKWIDHLLYTRAITLWKNRLTTMGKSPRLLQAYKLVQYNHLVVSNSDL